MEGRRTCAMSNLSKDERRFFNQYLAMQLNEAGEIIRQKQKEQKLPVDLLSILIQWRQWYEINIQFWPQQTSVFIAKDGVDLADFGGEMEYAITESIKYLERINNIGKKK